MPIKPPSRKNNTLAAIIGKAVPYLSMSEQIKPLEDEKKALAADLKEYATTNGTKDGDNKIVLDTDKVLIEVVTPVKNGYDEVKAFAVLQRLGLLEECTQRVVDPGALAIALQQGRITPEEILSFSEATKDTPRIRVVEK